MDRKELQLLSMYIVSESDKSKLSKLQLLNFVMEASEHQLMTFILDDQIIKTDEISEQIIEARFKVMEAGGRVAKLRKSYSSLTGVGFPVMWSLYRKIRSIYDVCTKRCGKFEVNTSRRQHCMLKCKVEKHKAQLVAAKKAKNDKETQKAKTNLMKANAALQKSIASFKSRGAEE